MPASYRLLCPIARALDHLGDRWTLLVLRDLQAGPMRFGEILAGLPGLASNLLASRLEKLRLDGLVDQDGAHYRLTKTGAATDAVMWELARFGMRFAPDPNLRRPGHFRLAAVTLQNGLRRVDPSPDTSSPTVELFLGDEPFSIRADSTGQWTVRYGAPRDSTLSMRTTYAATMAAASGELPLSEYFSEHVDFRGPRKQTTAFRRLIRRLMQEAFAAGPG